MIKVILCDFARVLLFPKDSAYSGRLDKLHEKLLTSNNGYNSFDYFELNEELLQFFTTLQGSISVSLFTTGLNHLVPDIKKRLVPVFDHMFYTGDFGIDKSEADAYTVIAHKLAKEPGEIIFIDDIAQHVEAARKAGLIGIHYSGNAELFSELKKYL
jgi:FMN phosphatase YigB (HAD superfamily)